MAEEIRDLTEKAVRGVLTFQTGKDFDKDRFEAEATKAKIGMAYERDRMLSERIGTGQVIRVVHMIASSPEEKRQYLEASNPKLVPVIKQKTA